MEKVMQDIREYWETYIGYQLADDVAKAIEVILQQVSEFKIYLSPENENYKKNVEHFVLTLFSCYQSGKTYNVELPLEKDIVAKCTNLIINNQSELFGEYDCIPNAELYHAIVILNECTGTREKSYYSMIERTMSNAPMMFIRAKQAVSRYAKFIQNTLQEMGQHLGMINQNQE